MRVLNWLVSMEDCLEGDAKGESGSGMRWDEWEGEVRTYVHGESGETSFR
jgi:hypothetical protein